jgi:formyl-CoA transferase
MRDTTRLQRFVPARCPNLTVGNPIKLSDSPVEVRPSPLFGEHTEEVLRTLLGLNDDDIHAARQQGAI